MNTEIATIIGLVVALIGIVGIYLKYRLDVHFYKGSKRREAAQEFRNCFINNLKGLYPHASEWPKLFLGVDTTHRGIFPELQSAVKNFRHFVPWYRRRAYDHAWIDYYNADKNPDCQHYSHYLGFQDEPDPKEQFRHNVDKLLSFAKYL